MEWKPFYRKELKDPAARERLTAWLDQGADPRMIEVLETDGILSVPHTAFAYSGGTIAKLASSLYRAGTKRILALGVLHTSMVPLMSRVRDERLEARDRQQAFDALAGLHLPTGDLIDTPYGAHPVWRPAEEPGVARQDRDDILAREFSLDTLISVLRLAGDLLAVPAVPILPVYVWLTRNPLTGDFDVADQVAAWIAHHWQRGTAVVTTGDLVHFGTAYGMDDDDPRQDRAIEELTAQFRADVDKTLRAGLTARDDDGAYHRSGDLLHNDQREILPILARLLGASAEAEILEFSLSDYASILDSPPPCLVASATVAYHRNRRALIE